jgi:hypothetical protein
MTHRIAMSPLAQPHGSLAKGAEQAQLPQFAAKRGLAAARSAELLPTTVTVNRKPNTHTTRINAGGYGAMGPHPERERLA